MRRGSWTIDTCERTSGGGGGLRDELSFFEAVHSEYFSIHGILPSSAAFLCGQSSHVEPRAALFHDRPVVDKMARIRFPRRMERKS